MSAPRQGKLTSPLEGWCRTAEEEEERTVIVRPRFSAGIEEAVEDLGRLGVRVQSAGAGAITAVVTPASLRSAAELPWVQAVEEPRTRRPLFPKY
jgi:hypothetical protein